MLEIGRVELPRRQDRHRRPAGAIGRCHRLHRLGEDVGIAVHRPYPAVPEQLGEHPAHHLAVLQHVGDARRRAAIVFEHHEFVGPGAHEVDADDMRPDVERRPVAAHLLEIGRVAGHHRVGDDAGLHDLLVAVDIGDEGVERAGPLDRAAFDHLPFRGVEDPRDHVEGDQPVRVAALAIDREGDTDPSEQRFRLGPARLQRLDPVALQPLDHDAVFRAVDCPIFHLVEDVRLHFAARPPVPPRMSGPKPILGLTLFGPGSQTRRERPQGRNRNRISRILPASAKKSGTPWQSASP